ncbi:hypothetical protein D1872_300530 [compost metagenome]
MKDLIGVFQDKLNGMKSNEISTVELRYLDVSYILTCLKTMDYYSKTFESQMKEDFNKIRLSGFPDES